MSRHVLAIAAVWFGIYLAVMALAAYVLFRNCAFDGCSLERAILFWAALLTAPVTLGGFGIHWFVVKAARRTIGQDGRHE